MKRAIGFVFLLMACLLTACAATSIERGPGGFRYMSQKDIAADELDVEITKPDGTVEKIHIKGLGSKASDVNAGWQSLFREMLQRIPVPIVSAPTASPIFGPPSMSTTIERVPEPDAPGEWN